MLMASPSRSAATPISTETEISQLGPPKVNAEITATAMTNPHIFAR